jgi:ADP-dependent NAD(P)H-hydrate dehydratase / NAD(P)H-hydrate epimerase
MRTDTPALPTLERVSGSRRPWPLLDTDAARRHEAAARDSVPPGTLMARAGWAVARLAIALAPRGRRVVVACGPGDNGGDGLVAARHLQAAGWHVQVHRLDGPRAPSPDTTAALAALRLVGLEPTPFPDDLAPADLVIDALLGLGSQRAPQGELARVIDAVNAAATPVLAIDLPSGLHPDTGALLGHQAVRAMATVCPLSLRPGCFTNQGRDHAGTVWLADLGYPAADATAWLGAAPPGPQRPHASHKGRFGDVIVLGGAPGMAGAAVLAAEAALAAGAGRVFLTMLGDAATALRPELMPRPSAESVEPTRLASATVVAGCGGGEAIAALLPPLLAHAARLVLDADALNAIAAEPALQQALRSRGARAKPTLLTPHPLEAARLLGTTAAAVQLNRLAAARQLAQSTGAAVLLKGSGSVIASPRNLPVINPTGNAALAGPGTGDVLAGWAGGRWACEAAADAATVAAAAAWQHGAAADAFAARHPGHPLRAAELIEQLLRGT